MGATLANIHIPNGEVTQIKSICPKAVIGEWARGCISVFSEEFQPGFVDKQARLLSKNMTQPILAVWLFDSDSVGFYVFQNGKCVASHIYQPDRYSKMGNIPLFCQTWGLPEEDVSRLRTVWKKGNAEEQLNLTAALMGLPLYRDHRDIPDRVYERDADIVDHWIKDRPAPPKIKNTAKAELLQEIQEFRISYHGCGQFSSSFYLSLDPYQDPNACERFHLWKKQPDGTLQKFWSKDCCLHYYASENRIVCMDAYDNTVQYDSAGSLRFGTPTAARLLFLDDGRLLQSSWPSLDEGRISMSCTASDGELLWERDFFPHYDVFAWNDQEVILKNRTVETENLLRIDLTDCRELGSVKCPVGTSIRQAVWHKDFWWITHDGTMRENGAWKQGSAQLTKLDKDLRILSNISLPSYSQDIFFSPDGRYVYVFLYQAQVMVIDAENLTVIHTLKDKSYLSPLGFDEKDGQPRLWLKRDYSGVEVWDMQLTKVMSRHRLKGMIAGCHRDQDENLCVTTWDERKCVFRVYRLV